MATNQSGTSKRAIPLVPYLHLPDKEGEDAYLEGARCRNCGEVYVGIAKRTVCIKCFNRDMERVVLGRTGELFCFTIVHQSAPGVQLPFIAAVVKLPEGPFVRANLVDCEPKPEALHAGMKLEMLTDKVRVDKAGNDIVTFQYRPTIG